MTEIEKLDKGLEYCFSDDEVAARKIKAEQNCYELNSLGPEEHQKKFDKIKEMLGSTGKKAFIEPNFFCDNGKNIHVGEDFIANYNVIILDIAPVHIGNYCMIGPNTLITTVGHPLSPKRRRQKAAQAEPVSIGNDVWIGGSCTILQGITIGNNVVIAAGAIVTKDIPDNCLVAGVPAKKIRDIEDDTRE